MFFVLNNEELNKKVTVVNNKVNKYQIKERKDFGPSFFIML